MGGCSSKPQTSECSNEGLLDQPPPLDLLFHTDDSAALHGSQHTLKSLFSQHSRDDDDLLGNAQTLHELLLHAVDSIEQLPDSENQSTAHTGEENLERSSLPYKQSSPVSVLSNASTCTKIEGCLPSLAEVNEETGAQVQVAEENEKKCIDSKEFASDFADDNQEMGAVHLAGFLEEEKSGKSKVTLLALPEENVQDCIKAEGFLSNVAEEKHESAGKLAPTSDFSKTSEPNLLESSTPDVLQKIEASDAMESKAVDLQESLHAIAMKDEIKRDMQDETSSEAERTPKQDVKCMKNEKNSSQVDETEEHLAKAMEGAETEKALEGKTTDVQPEKVLEIEKDGISKGEEKADVQSEKAMEGELLKVKIERGGISEVQGEKAMEEDTLQENVEKSMDCEKLHMQGEKEWKMGVKEENFNDKIEVQIERGFDGKVEEMQGDGEDKNTVYVEQPESMQDTEKEESQDEKKTGVQNEKTRVQRREAGVQDEETGKQCEGRVDNEKDMTVVPLFHANTENEEAMADVPYADVNQSLAFTDSEQMLCIERHAKLEHDVVDVPQHFEADKGDDEKNVVALVLAEILIKAAVGNGDDKSALELCAKEEKKAPEASVEQSLHEGNPIEENSNIHCASKPVNENNTSDADVNMEVSSEMQRFVQEDCDTEKLQCGNTQMPTNVLDVITSKGQESHMQPCNESTLCSIPETSVHENVPGPTVDVEKNVVDIDSSSPSAKEKSSIECKESKFRQETSKTSGEGIDAAAEKIHKEASKQCDEKGEGLKATEELENLEI